MESVTQKSGITYFEIENRIGILTIDNGRQNKITPADFLDLDQFQQWVSNPELKGLIITGKGRHFSAGADIEALKAAGGDLDKFKQSLGKGKEILNVVEGLSLITVAAISGVCFGGGLEIALSCQFRISTANAVFAFPEVDIGVMPGMAGTVRLPRLVGRNKALEILVSGRTLNAGEALAIGLVDRVVPAREHLSAAQQFIEELTRNKSPRQIRSIVHAVNLSRQPAESKAMVTETELFLELVREMEG